ncbi:Estrogen receptor Hypothetical protein site associated, antigen, 9 [Nesidiocoris tenuis]|uniref:Receptor-binding cancer antigen expressed on SiSo cells n=1 Tax=Nesidiocoris tenuis TaxID=355587 RepID=A0ABN7AJE7_9HEMI|nr:Estrogen receptor Hypothetical protein site associated, antigen, 9 [Nesidiocoris tenuis]
MILQKLKAVLVFLLNLVKRSLCCFRRRRKSSADVVPLTDVGVVPDYKAQTRTHADQREELANWNGWGDEPKAPQSIEEHIQLYRSQRMAASQPESNPQSESQVDFFQDMEPAIRKQKKVILRPKDSPQMDRLAFNPSNDIAVPDDLGELKSWEESEKRDGYWGDSSDWNAEELLRAKRKEEKRRKAMERGGAGTVT